MGAGAWDRDMGTVGAGGRQGQAQIGRRRLAGGVLLAEVLCGFVLGQVSACDAQRRDVAGDAKQSRFAGKGLDRHFLARRRAADQLDRGGIGVGVDDCALQKVALRTGPGATSSKGGWVSTTTFRLGDAWRVFGADVAAQADGHDGNQYSPSVGTRQENFVAEGGTVSCLIQSLLSGPLT